MKQIVIIHDEGADGEEAITNWVKRLMCMDACRSLNEEILTRWVIARKDFAEVSAKNLKDTWTTVAISENSIEPRREEKDTSFRTEEIVPLEARLHEIADSFPYLDCVVHLFIFLQSDDLQTKESFIPLAGAIKRLVEWHNARAMIVKLHSELSLYGQMLVDFSNCHSISVMDMPHIEWPHWHGKLSVMDHVKCEGRVFPHFTLHHKKWNCFIKMKTPDNNAVRNNKRQRRSLKNTVAPRQGLTVCGRQIEVLQEIDLRTFPIFMLTPWTLELQTFHDGSHSFKSFVQGMQSTGLLARVRMFYNLKQLPSCGDTKSFCSSAWKDYITRSPKRVTEPKEELISPCVKFMYLLILPNNFLQTVATSSSPPLLAHILLSPTEMSPAIFRSLDQQFSLGKSQTKERKDETVNQIHSAILSLPMVKADKFHRIMQLLQEHQTFAVKNWLDGEIDLSKEECLQMMTSLEEHALDCMIEGCENVETYNEENMPRTKEKSFTWISECSRPLSVCPEKIALQLVHDHIEKSCKTDNFSSSTPLSERKQREKSGAKDFLIEDVLESFQPDGAQKQTTKSPVKLKCMSICRITSQPDLSSKWPDNQFIKYHDVYYYNSEEDLNFEKKFVELRDKGNFEDTRSSFVTPKKKPQSRPVLRLSPVRSSPRSKIAHHSLSRAHSQSLSSGSPMKKFKTTSDLFKHPLSRIIRKSPRKRQASPLTPSSNPPPFKLARTHQIGSMGSLSDLGTPVRRSPRKKLIDTPQMPCDPKVKRLSLTPVSEKALRRSPRKTPSSSLSASFGSGSLPRSQSFILPSGQSSHDSSLRDSSQEGPSAENKMSKMKRSDRHKMRLQSIIATVLREKDVKKGDAIYSSCFRNLFNVSLVLLKALPNSRNLTEEMKSVVYAQVQQIINLEKRRSGIAL